MALQLMIVIIYYDFADYFGDNAKGGPLREIRTPKFWYADFLSCFDIINHVVFFLVAKENKGKGKLKYPSHNNSMARIASNVTKSFKEKLSHTAQPS